MEGEHREAEGRHGRLLYLGERGQNGQKAAEEPRHEGMVQQHDRRGVQEDAQEPYQCTQVTSQEEGRGEGAVRTEADEAAASDGY